MKTKILASFIVILAIGIFAYWRLNKSGNFPSQNDAKSQIVEITGNSLNEADAQNLLINKIETDSLYTSFTTLQCLHFYTEESTADYFSFAVREKHGDGCSGDPYAEPIVDRFKVMRETKNIFYYDVVQDTYFPYDRSKLQVK